MIGRDGSATPVEVTGYSSATKAVRLKPDACAADFEALCAKALRLYGVRVLDNVDLSRLDGAARGFVIAGALMERGDARGFEMARQLLQRLER
jgi:hypothetical protein